MERPPRLFSGPGAVRLPASWHWLIYAEGAGTTIEFRTLDSAAFIYRDHIEVERLF